MRLDIFLVKNGYIQSRTKAEQTISRGEVFVNGLSILKPSFNIDENNNNLIEIKDKYAFVSLGGYKMQKALDSFNFSVKNFTVADIGASTGGFTQCLLNNGAKKAYAVDLNDDLLDISLKNDKRVIPVIKNVKDLNINDFPEIIDLFVADLSFISSSVYLPILSNLCQDGSNIILLIKPQFELGKKIKNKNGIIKDDYTIKQICKKVYDTAVLYNLAPINMTIVPFVKDKNKEYLILLKKNAQQIDFEHLFSKANNL